MRGTILPQEDIRHGGKIAARRAVAALQQIACLYIRQRKRVGVVRQLQTQSRDAGILCNVHGHNDRVARMHERLYCGQRDLHCIRQNQQFFVVCVFAVLHHIGIGTTAVN